MGSAFTNSCLCSNTQATENQSTETVKCTTNTTIKAYYNNQTAISPHSYQFKIKKKNSCDILIQVFYF